MTTPTITLIYDPSASIPGAALSDAQIETYYRTVRNWASGTDPQFLPIFRATSQMLVVTRFRVGHAEGEIDLTLRYDGIDYPVAKSGHVDWWGGGRPRPPRRPPAPSGEAPMNALQHRKIDPTPERLTKAAEHGWSTVTVKRFFTEDRCPNHQEPA